MLVGWDKRLRGEHRLLLVVMWLQNHRTGLLRAASLRELHFSTLRFVKEATREGRVFKYTFEGGENGDAENVSEDFCWIIWSPPPEISLGSIWIS